jgi:dolichyl-diphosphooligosaccharide--protein glycosyltransferase
MLHGIYIVATTAMTLTFYVWTRTLRGSDDNGKSALLWGTLTGVAYFYMVLSWGGYVFVINLIGVHAAVLCALGRFTTKLHRGYTAFYLVGTALAIQVPVVGWTPLRSLEQLGPCAVFLGFQLLEYCEIIKRRQTLSPKQTWILRFQVAGGALVVAALLGYAFVPRTYFGPISSRVRGLFVEHTKTGNPLVDSVAEHQPASEQAYFQYLLNIVFIAPVGLVMVALLYFHDASSFLLVYGAAAYFFSHRMVRLILLTAPIGSALGGVALGHVWSWALTSLFPYGEFATLRLGLGDILSSFHSPTDETPTDTNSSAAQKKKTGKNTKKKDAKTVIAAGGGAVNQFSPILVVLRLVHLGIAMYGILLVRPYVPEFLEKAEEVAIQMSHPTILFKGTTRDGKEVTVDDYREAYWWLRDNTPEDARIMAWWDYGYQITAIANRTTIADGNTWNHEHIALLGRTLTSPEKEGHRIARHLADYVLVWAGGGGDDVAKSPHLARIANSVYRFICPGDPTCRIFGYDVRSFV